MLGLLIATLRFPAGSSTFEVVHQSAGDFFVYLHESWSHLKIFSEYRTLVSISCFSGMALGLVIGSVWICVIVHVSDRYFYNR